MGCYKSIQDRLVGNLYLPISLRICHRGKLDLYPPFLGKIFKELTVGLDSVVSDNDLRHSESADDRLPNEFFNVGSLNVNERYCFHPFRKVINCNDRTLL